MLNQFRIGTKLIAGFAIVLMLLVAVWLMARWADSQQKNALKEIAVADHIASATMKMQRDVYNTLLSSKNEVIHREKQYADEVQKLIGEVLEEYADIVGMIQNPEIRKDFEGILDNIKQFAEDDKKYWNTEVERQEVRAARTDAAGKSLDAAENLLKGIGNAIEAQCRGTGTIMNKNTGEEKPGVDVYAVEQVGWEREVNRMIVAILDARRMCFQYEASRSEEEKQDLLTRFETEFKTIDEIIAFLLTVLVTNEALIKELDADLKVWMNKTKETIRLENELTIIDVAHMALAAKLVTEINKVYVAAEARAGRAAKTAEELDNWVQWTLISLSAVAVIFGALISWVLTRNITQGLMAACNHLQNIAHEGDVSVDVPGFFLARKDEVGDLAQAVNAIQEHFRDVERLADSLAKYDYSVELKVCGEKDTMGINLNHMIEEISVAIHEINEDARQVATGANEVSSASQSLSSGAQQMAASLEEITATMHEISGQTKTNAESAGQARDLAQASSKVAAEGQSVMHELTGAMTRITENSHEIQRVIKVVDDIAFQTNLLALNAAVEAARAGQHGKGFAVVAEEVRNLAARSAKAARETAELIAKSSQEIDRGGEIASHTSGVFDTIVEQIKQTTDLVAGIAIASNEQAQGVGQVSTGLHQIDGVTQTNTASAEESASAANEMSSMAKSLQELVAKFKLRDVH